MEDIWETFAHSINQLNQRLVRVERLQGAILDALRAPAKKAEKKKKEEEEYHFGPAYSLVQNVNIYPEKIHGEPKRTEITSIGVAMRFVGNEDLISVATDTGLSYAIGYAAGWADSKIVYHDLSQNSDIINALVELRYGPAVDLTNLVINDKEYLRSIRNEVENYACELNAYQPNQVVSFENGKISYCFSNTENR